MHYYTFSPKDYMSKAHYLDHMEDLAYRRMLDYCYLNEKPLPEDVEEIGKLIGMRTHSESIANVLRYFFDLTADGYINDRVVREIEEYRNKSAKAKASAQARWDKKSSKNSDIADNKDAMRTHSEGNANYKLETNNYKLDTKEKKFVFKTELISLGADKQLADDWLIVRSGKKAASTKTALDGFMSQVEKSGLSLNTVLKICVDNSWSGFKQSWLQNINLNEYQTVEPAAQQEVIESEWVDF